MELPAFLCSSWLLNTTPFIELWNLSLKPALLYVEHEKTHSSVLSPAELRKGVVL